VIGNSAKADGFKTVAKQMSKLFWILIPKIEADFSDRIHYDSDRSLVGSLRENIFCFH